MVPRSARVDVEAVQLRVELYEQDVRMPANEESGRVAAQFVDHCAIVAWRSSADMRHPHPNASEGKALVLGEFLPGLAIVDIAPHRAQRFPLRQFIGHMRTADVACVPDLVAFGHMGLDPGIEPAVGIAEKADAWHGGEDEDRLRPHRQGWRSGYFCAPPMEILPRYFLEISFNGTAYSGWQRQLDANSVQAEVEKALQFLLHQHKVNAIGCGRTDAGVHAAQFYLHFDGPSDRVLDERFVYGLNSLLPDDIAVFRLIPVADDAHARFSATERGYCYRIHQRKDPFLTNLSHQLKPVLDLAAMNEACKVLIGQQDFSSFQKVGSDVKTSICDVRAAYWEAVPNGYHFHIKADRFLRNMVRAIVGTCLRIGKGQQPAAHMAEVLAAHDRHAAGRSAPACGLYLEHVVYPFIAPDLRAPHR